MRVIALMTMIFLPGTFFATVFALPLLDWTAEYVIQSRFWIYVVFSVPSTILIWLLWVLFTAYPKPFSKTFGIAKDLLWKMKYSQSLVRWRNRRRSNAGPVSFIFNINDRDDSATPNSQSDMDRRTSSQNGRRVHVSESGLYSDPAITARQDSWIAPAWTMPRQPPSSVLSPGNPSPTLRHKHSFSNLHRVGRAASESGSIREVPPTAVGVRDGARAARQKRRQRRTHFGEKY